MRAPFFFFPCVLSRLVQEKEGNTPRPKNQKKIALKNIAPQCFPPSAAAGGRSRHAHAPERRRALTSNRKGRRPYMDPTQNTHVNSGYEHCICSMSRNPKCAERRAAPSVQYACMRMRCVVDICRKRDFAAALSNGNAQRAEAFEFGTVKSAAAHGRGTDARGPGWAPVAAHAAHRARSQPPTPQRPTAAMADDIQVKEVKVRRRMRARPPPLPQTQTPLLAAPAWRSARCGRRRSATPGQMRACGGRAWMGGGGGGGGARTRPRSLGECLGSGGVHGAVRADAGSRARCSHASAARARRERDNAASAC